MLGKGRLIGPRRTAEPRVQSDPGGGRPRQPTSMAQPCGRLSFWARLRDMFKEVVQNEHENISDEQLIARLRKENPREAEVLAALLRDV